MGQIPKGEFCAGCGTVSDGRHLDRDLLLIGALLTTPNPCCGIPGPCRMDAPEGPVCHCGKPSSEQSGICGDCAEALRK